MTDISKIPATQNTIEDPPEYAAAAGPSNSSGNSEAISQDDPRGQLKWNEQRSGETEAAPSSSDAITQANSSHASEATMRYNPRDSVEDRTQEDPLGCR